jgi:ribonuclease D
LDTETTGDFTDLFDRRIVMLQLGCGNTQVVLDTRKEDPTALLKSIKDSNKRILGHNLKYDYQVIKTNYDVPLENLWDTMLAAQIIECGLEAPKGHFTLEQTVARYVRPYYTKQGNLFAPTVTKQIRSSFAEIGDHPF